MLWKVIPPNPDECHTLWFLLFAVVVMSGAKVMKMNRLNILATLPLSGSMQRDGKICMKAMEFVVHETNYRSDILPDYQVAVSYRDESAGNMAVRVAFDYLRQREDFVKQGIFVSPVVAGPMSGAGCQRLAAMAHKLNMVIVTSGCAAPESTQNRQTYPNLYRTRIPTESVNYLRIVFMKKIARAKKLAIVTQASIPADHYVSVLLYKQAVVAGLNVVWFNSLISLLGSEDTMRSLHTSGARYIVVGTAGIDFTLEFFCAAYLQGITGSKYVEIRTNTAFTDPATLLSERTYGGCNRSIIVEQMKYAFWMGSLYFGSPDENNSATILGFTLDSFDRSFLAFVNYSKTSDYERRHVCHDTMLQAILTLHNADILLKKSHNISFKNCITETTPSATMMKVVNASAGLVDYVSLRAGRQRYSSRLEMDSEPQYIAYWSPAKGFHLLSRIVHIEGDISNTSNYRIEGIKQFVWQTWNGQPPRDGPPPIVLIKQDIPLAFTIFMTVMVGLQASLHLFLLIYNGKSLKENPESVVFFAGCMFANAAGICFSWSVALSEALCVLKYCLAIACLSIFHAFEVAKLRELYNIFMVARRDDTGRRLPRLKVSNQVARPSSIALAGVETRKNVGKIQMTVTGLFLLGNICIFIAWVKVDKFETLTHFDEIVVDEVSDFALQLFTATCSSEYHLEWLLILLAFHGILLFEGTFLSYQMRRIVPPSGNEVSAAVMQKFHTIFFYRLAIVNSCAVLVASSLVLYIIPGQQSKEMAAAIALLIASSSALAFVYLPKFFKSRRNNRVHQATIGRNG